MKKLKIMMKVKLRSPKKLARQRRLKKLQEMSSNNFMPKQRTGMFDEDLTIEDIIKIRKSNLAKAFSEALSPKPKLTVTQWADEFRVIPAVSGHEAGLWRTSRFPFLKRIQDLLSPEDPCQQVVVMKGAQVGFTEVSLNWMFYIIHYHPVPMMYVQKTLDNIKAFIAQRFDPALEEMPEVRDKIGFLASEKKAINTQRIRMFPGGMLRFAGANSPSSLRSMPIGYLMLDEEDSYDVEVGTEGSPSQLAIVRTRNFPRRKVYRLSTPTIKQISVIEPLFEGGTKERFHLPCPHCGNMDWIRWENIHKVLDDKGNLIGAELVCEKGCGAMIEEFHKTEMLSKGLWVAENPFAPYPSFHLSSLYSPFGFFSWFDAMQQFVHAHSIGNPSLLKTFVNTVLGETWDESGRTVKAGWLMKRKRDYGCEVPEPVILLTTATDVQDDRLESEMIGWSRDMQQFSIEYRVFMGDTAKNEVWEQLDLWLRKWHKHASGVKIPKGISVIDSKFRSSIVHKFCRAREHLNVYPIQGKAGWGRGLVERPNKRNKYGAFKFDLYTDELKSSTQSRLLIDEVGPGYCHFPDLNAYNTKYFKMLTSETLKKVWSNGRHTLRWWKPEHVRNEVFDLRVYNAGALEILNIDFSTLPVNQVVKVAFGKKNKPRTRKVHSKGF